MHMTNLAIWTLKVWSFGRQKVWSFGRQKVWSFGRPKRRHFDFKS